MTRVDAPVAIVTGAAEGLGHAIAARLLADGHPVVASDINPAINTAFAGSDSGDRLRTVVVDAGAADSGELLAAEALRSFGRIDAIVNNAGVGGPGSLVEDLDLDDLVSVFNINVLGAVRLCQAVIPYLKEQGSGRIINIGSVFADNPVIAGSAYSMSKAAIKSLSQSLALELGPFGITVNTIAPGYMMTRMHEEEVALQAAGLGVSVEERLGTLRESVPLRRHGTGQDVAGVVAWLLSPDSSYVTGQTVGVNGGIAVT
jgi:NAD(P)-dependent dehydrogenase (short-subunit alcohol dehydrogenase family)